MYFCREGAVLGFAPFAPDPLGFIGPHHIGLDQDAVSLGCLDLASFGFLWSTVRIKDQTPCRSLT